MSAFYLSNVEQYLRQDNKWTAFCRNSASLPLDETSVFIRPSGGVTILSRNGVVVSPGSVPPGSEHRDVPHGDGAAALAVSDCGRSESVRRGRARIPLTACARGVICSRH